MWPFNSSNGRCSRCRVDGISGVLLSQFPNLVLKRNLKFGEMWRCQKCETPWFLTSNRQWIHRIGLEFKPLVAHWNETALDLTLPCLRAATGIGGVRNDWEETVILPCAVTTKNGERFEKAILQVTKTPPYRWYSLEKVRWAWEIAELEGSRFTLPLQVRRASHEKREEAMGFAPTDVQSNDGRSFTLGNASDFFEHEGVTGPNIQLAPRPRKRNVVPFAETQAWFWVDWNDDLVEKITTSAEM